MKKVKINITYKQRFETLRGHYKFILDLYYKEKTENKQLKELLNTILDQ